LLAGLLSISYRAPVEGAQISCNRFIIGDPTGAPSVEIRTVPPGGASGTVSGVANNIDTSKVHLSGWAHTDRYYPQPLLTQPFTCIPSDGSWSYFTNPWKRVIVLLVDDTYQIPTSPSNPSIDYHPSTDPGVLAWAEIPPSRTISFGGEQWWVKDSAPYATGPGPCVFSPAETNVFVDNSGRLNLSIVQQATGWTCTEVVLDRSRGHGTYTFQVVSPLNALDHQEVFSGFLFESLTREIDIECSPVLTGREDGCQYVVQPFDTPGNRLIFSIPSGSSTHRILWSADHIEFLSWKGLQPFPPDPADIIQDWEYTGPDIPPPGRERMRFNFWLFNGQPPVGGQGATVVIDGFQFSPPQADLSITKTDGQTTAVPGTPITYTIAASNAGPSATTGATVTDTVPAAIMGATWTCVGAGGGTCTSSGSGNINDTVNLPVGGTVTYTLTGTINPSATGSLSNTATVTAPGGVTDPNLVNNSATDTDTLTPQADLSITKTDGQETAVPGSPVTYRIVASNAGPSAVTGATVADTVPAAIMGATWTCVGAGGGTCTPSGSGNINDTVNLPVGGTVTYTLTGTINPSAMGSLSNAATVTAPGGVTDPNPANNFATDTDTLRGLDYFTLPPCRVVDTRGGGGVPIGGPVLQGQETRVLAVAGNCGIPATAKAISINLAVTQSTAAGHLRLLPAGQAMPNVSSINYAAGQTRANNAIVSLDFSGHLAAFVGQPTGTTVHLIIDVNGYFE